MKALNIDDMNKYKENKLQEKSVETEPEKKMMIEMNIM